MDKPLVKGSEEVYRIASDEIDTTKRAKSEIVAAESEQTSSSSFGDSDSEVENADNVDNFEAVSGFRESALDSDCREVFNMRKKKTTAHWRSFIQPLMWHIKWVELQMKNLQSQAEKYDGKIEKYRKQKQVQVENTTLEGIGIKSIPFSWKVPRPAILKRKKRKRTETTKDLATCLSHHSLLSYYENLKSVTGGSSIHDNFQNSAKLFQKINIDDELLVSDEPLRLQHGDIDNSLECLLRKIEELQSRVGMMKGRTDILIRENAGMFPDMENSFLPMVNNDIRSSLERNASSQLMCEYTSALPVPESAVLGHTEDFPNINGSRDHASYDSLNNGEAEFHTNNQTMKEEEKNFEEVIIPQAQNTQVNCGESNTTPVAADSGLHREDQSPQKACTALKVTAPKRKRKARRKGPNWWS